MSQDPYSVDISGIDAAYYKSEFSGNGNACVEVSEDAADGEPHPDGMVLVRDSKRPDLCPLRFHREEWDAFEKGIREGAITLRSMV